LDEQIVGEWNSFSSLIKDKEDQDSLFTSESLINFPKYTKEEIEQILASPIPQLSISEEAKPEIHIFNNILSIEGFLKSEQNHPQPYSSSSSLPSSPPKVQIPTVPTMVVNIMDAIIAARYAPLVLPQNLNAFPTGDYMKYFPRFNGEGDVTVEEHLASFYSFADNFNIEHSDVWMRVFVQSLDGEVRKWFRGLHVGSITDIDVLDETFETVGR
jgi:hypothetical protein